MRICSQTPIFGFSRTVSMTPVSNCASSTPHLKADGVLARCGRVPLRWAFLPRGHSRRRGANESSDGRIREHRSDEVYERYLDRPIADPFTRVLLDYAAPRRGNRVLARASGTGSVARHVAAMVGVEGWAVAVGSAELGRSLDLYQCREYDGG